MGRRKIEIQPITVNIHYDNTPTTIGCVDSSTSMSEIAPLPSSRSAALLLYRPQDSDVRLQRKNGLFKKAYELGVLCAVDVAVIIFSKSPDFIGRPDGLLS
jgi:hypothetical protein